MVLQNKLGLTDSLELAKQEEKFSKEKAKRLFEENLLVDKVAGFWVASAGLSLPLEGTSFGDLGRPQKTTLS